MKATIEIKMDNVAFEENPGIELARILKGLAEDVGDFLDDTSAERFFNWKKPIFDVNGNHVGNFIFKNN